MKTLKIPRTLNLSEGSDIKFSEGQDADKKRRISMVAYSGKPTRYMGMTTVIDLSGVKMRRAKSPIYLEHDPGKRLGWSEAVDNNGKTISVGGKFLSRSTEADNVISDMEDGYPWNVSMGFDVLKTKVIEQGQTAEVNGRTVKGPALIFSQTEIHEFSLTSNGVDPSTTAALFSSESQQGQTIEVEVPDDLKLESDEDSTTETAPVDAGQERSHEMADPIIPPVSAPSATPAPNVAPEPVAATVAELKAAFSSKPDFIVEMLEKKSTMNDAFRQWSIVQAAEVERLKAENLRLAAVTQPTAAPVGVNPAAASALVDPDEAKWSSSPELQARWMSKEHFINAQKLNRGELPGFRNKTAARS